MGWLSPDGTQLRSGLDTEILRLTFLGLRLKDQQMVGSRVILGLRYLNNSLSYGGFHSHGGIPIAGWFMSWENTSKMDDLRIPLFQETSILQIDTNSVVGLISETPV